MAVSAGGLFQKQPVYTRLGKQMDTYLNKNAQIELARENHGKITFNIYMTRRRKYSTAPNMT
jgi:hypothetical protein